ncbi:TPA: tRNA (adenine-N(1))-methyltransferase [Streptococcus equi subsp. zooepidemicus]|uniref:tRNA (adenine(22)-N(1))-methyltransferase n=1 Tax=Streptococcus equi TaxID=1336 RepID=UPI001E406CE7|nr:tRNA (adenine(22)-N(1))-methyltransferase TrmK [Streptococcus equi]MCD3404669.1 tRNA (adenine(22)-N(1))-methyltransferase TrmK [Streptococcus equi subsp. zooepidemicus]HEL0714677.1 tRNA (adenine-N(1))-methyltransferase [Streptococcus equi subsp. zooepidemicus]HEL1204817.1 tRNA (adenine-N(1))-methyltransferase [Streptococcus equi subsp. zooepidemicus]HEL1307364.1 tRNA (adenine-N(1))-methyltransferase [Streptococcus equi subsp. zooepidemicus]
MESHLSKRLRHVAAYVPDGAKLLDVGSDHAYLPIFLVEAGQIQKAIAGEVVKGPFASALKNVSQYGLTEHIEVRLADGLAAFEVRDAVDCITICGMGGRLIADILAAGKEKLQGVGRLILQPNNREDELRAWLSANAFRIIAETIMTENGKYYEIIVAEPGQKSLTDQELCFGPFLSQERSSVFVAKWQRELDKLAYVLSCVPEARAAERASISQKIKAIEEVISHES